MRRRTALRFLFILSLANVIIFIFREHFMYKPYTDHASLYSSCDASCTMKWKQFVTDYPIQELGEARGLTDKLIDSSATTKGKILQIGKFLVNKFKGKEGEPSDTLMQASPLQQYKILSSEDSAKLWCGNYAQMFSWFCWAEGITTRTIEFMIPGDRHVVNECYVPETGSWVLVDLTHNLLFAEDASSKGGFDLQQFREQIQKSPVVVCTVSSDSIVKTSLNNQESFIIKYYSKNVPFFYYNRVNNERVYTMGNKLVSYVLPVSWYEILDTKQDSNLLFYVKEILLFLWMISFFAFLAGRTKSTS